MLSLNGIIKIRGYRSAGVFGLEKQHALAVGHVATVGNGALNQAPSSSCQRISSSTPHVQPSDGEDVPVKIVQIDADATQTTHIAGNLGNK
jgi:hypothetical protein